MKAKSGVLCVIVKVIFVIFWPRAFHCQTQAFSDLSVWSGLEESCDIEAEKCRSLEMELSAVRAELMEMKAELGVERSDHDALRMVVGVVCDDLGMSQSEGVSSLAVRAFQIGDRARELTQTALHFGVNYTFRRDRHGGTE